jgi:hypothetical protein
MKKYMIIVGLLLGSLLWLASCRDKKDEPDHCAQRGGPINADFLIEEGGNSLNCIEVKDTVQYGSLVSFTAKQDFDEYIWRIGDDTLIRRTKTFDMVFYKPYKDIKVQLIGKRNSDPCKGGGVSMDTVVKTIQVVDITQIPLLGTYKGTFEDDPTKEYVLSVYLKKVSQSEGNWELEFKFLEGMRPERSKSNQTRDHSSRLFALGANWLAANTSRQKENAIGFLEPNSNVIHLKYWAWEKREDYWVPADNNIFYHFIGHRISTP